MRSLWLDNEFWFQRIPIYKNIMEIESFSYGRRNQENIRRWVMVKIHAWVLPSIILKDLCNMYEQLRFVAWEQEEGARNFRFVGLTNKALPLINQLQWAEPFFTSLQSLSWSRNCPPFMEPSVYYRVHNSPPLDSTLSQMNPTLTLFGFHERRGISWSSDKLSACQEGLCFMDLVT
jgi:hypothetical protein